MRPLTVAALLLLLALLSAIGCQSMRHKDGRSRWLPPAIISTDQWWGEKELGDIGN